MDHSHHDRTYKKSRVQQELEQSVSRKLISSLLLGCLLFCIAIAAVNALNQNARREDHLESVASTFHEVYNNTSAFLLDAGHTELFLSELRNDQDNLRYLISHYNVSALVEIQLILTDSKGNVRFTTFSEGEMNLHRQEFNYIAVDNACHLMRTVYTTVYHFRANSSEYVMIHPLYRDGEYQGAAAVYLNENDWTKLFSQYQYDAILTKSNGDVITCSNSSFLSQKNANKYLPADAAQYVRVNGNRYLRSSRSLENGTVLAYSFIYSPTNYSYLFVGLLLIVLLGLSWAAMFARIMHAMTEQMVKSVDTLVREIRIIRKEDPDHIIEIDTGDEIEEIARQVNKMVRSIQELSQRNIALAEVNNRMEMQNLQAQINPHFIYNTLDNIRYLIPTDPQRAQQLIGRFIGILRYSINNTKHNVPVKDDLKYLQDYLVIQSTRFGANFSYEIDIDDACMEFIIPKLLLQPLLENSIKYGFQKKPRIHIRVRGWLGEDALYFTVEDNGGGVDETMLEQLRDILRSDEVNIEHNGLQNINRKGIRYSVPWEECGCSVVGEAENGAVGEEKIAELQPDIVITDITMPVKNGLEMIADTREKFNYIAIILTGYSEFEYAQQAIRNGVSDYVLKPLDMDEMRTALEKAVRLAGDNQYLQKREDEAEAVRSRTALPPLSEDKVTDPLVLRIVAYLKENYQSKITLADLQEQFHYSERYINQKFQKELGTTVIDYLNRCRIQNALELIRKGKLPISQIGWECGIGEYKYFNHVFKKYIGCSVREYQNTLK